MAVYNLGMPVLQRYTCCSLQAPRHSMPILVPNTIPIALVTYKWKIGI